MRIILPGHHSRLAQTRIIRPCGPNAVGSPEGRLLPEVRDVDGQEAVDRFLTGCRRLQSGRRPGHLYVGKSVPLSQEIATSRIFPASAG